MGVHPKAKQIAEYVVYEKWMFSETVKRLTSGPVADRYQMNLLIEVVLLHARVIYEFLFEPGNGKYPKDVRAVDFFDRSDQWQPDLRVLCPFLNKANLERLNRALHHLSYDRLDYEQNKSWDIPALASDIEKAWNEFLSQLPKERQQWFSAS